MNRIKKGDYVSRQSYENDLFFRVEKILKLNNGEEIALLKGLTIRIEADSPIQDLNKVSNEQLIKCLNELENKIEKRLLKGKAILQAKRKKELIVTGKILHLDGDKKYSEKSYKYYKKLKLNAIVKNIPESKQPHLVYKLLQFYRPDILIVTGHDGMIRSESGYTDIYNYRNSKYFIETVKEARRYENQSNKKIVIFAGACQSYFEALISAGANFASSPARILIDFLDPLIVAEHVATTEKYKFIKVDDFEQELRDGRQGIDGLGCMGKKEIIYL